MKMGRKSKCFFGICILIICLFSFNNYLLKVKRENAAITEMENLVKTTQEEIEKAWNNNIVFDEPYTMIINHSSPMYLTKLELPAEVMDSAIKWTHPNGVYGFDISMGSTYVRYVEGHIDGKQLAIYAPYIYVDEEFVFE